jgi:hypothetical protein
MEKLNQILSQANINTNEFDRILTAIIGSCTKDAVSVCFVRVSISLLTSYNIIFCFKKDGQNVPA